MGHFTLVGDDQDELIRRLASIRNFNYSRRYAAMTVKVGVIMGSNSDWSVMQGAVEALKSLEVSVEATVVSAHRTPERLMEYSKSARARGLEVIVAGAGETAHLPGMVAAYTELPVVGVPVVATHLNGEQPVIDRTDAKRSPGGNSSNQRSL